MHAKSLRPLERSRLRPRCSLVCALMLMIMSLFYPFSRTAESWMAVNKPRYPNRVSKIILSGDREAASEPKDGEVLFQTLVRTRHRLWYLSRFHTFTTLLYPFHSYSSQGNDLVKNGKDKCIKDSISMRDVADPQ